MEDSMAKKSASKNRSGKRDLVKRKQASAYAKRTTKGRFQEMDDVPKSLRQDRKTKAKRKVKPGYGDRGDQKRRA
jgi:hypothetical protein